MEDKNEPLMLWAQELFPICRSLTGDGVRKTLAFINQQLSTPLTLHEVPSHTQVFDWSIPQEWNIKTAWVKNQAGDKVIDFDVSNLHVVNYSHPIDKTVDYTELEQHLFSLPEQPNAIPYITSYYRKNWGFCLSQHQRDKLNKDEKYHVFIDSELSDGSLTYGDLLIKGETSQEILLSTYVCHPSMANNELSGPLVTLALVNRLLAMPKRKYSYRVVFVPETIGAITYLSKHYQEMQEKTQAGFVITCVGDTQTYSFMPSRTGDTLADRVGKLIINECEPQYKHYSFLQRGSDERQYCHPNIDLPVVSLMRSKYGEYAQYHTSLDDLSFISQEGLIGSVDMYQSCIELLEHNCVYKSLIMCEPQLGKRGLYTSLGVNDHQKVTPRNLLNFLTYIDGKNDLIDICEITKVASKEIIFYAQLCLEHQLITKV